MNRLKLKLCIAILFFFVAQPVLAVPTFQTHVDGTAASIGEDENTWFTTESTFDLTVVGAYKGTTTSLTNVTLVVSVLDGSQGTITITGPDGVAPLTVVGTSSPYNPSGSATVDMNGDTVADGYDNKNEFLPTPILDDDDVQVNFNDHYPFKDDVSDFLLFDLGSFDNDGLINNYSAEDGIEEDAGDGEEKIYSVIVTGFEGAHFDVYGFDGSAWRINPASHDSTYTVPAPGAMILGSIGVGLVGWLRRRRAL